MVDGKDRMSVWDFYCLKGWCSEDLLVSMTVDLDFFHLLTIETLTFHCSFASDCIEEVNNVPEVH